MILDNTNRNIFPQRPPSFVTCDIFQALVNKSTSLLSPYPCNKATCLTLSEDEGMTETQKVCVRTNQYQIIKEIMTDLNPKAGVWQMDFQFLTGKAEPKTPCYYVRTKTTSNPAAPSCLATLAYHCCIKIGLFKFLSA